MPDRDELHSKIDRLAEPELVVVDRVVDAVLLDIRTVVRPDSWLTTPAFTEAFTARLKTHHALDPKPLMTTGFEAAFNHAGEAAGWTVMPAVSAINRFFDTVIELPNGARQRVSLKSTAMKKMSRASLYISKLADTAWVQDTRRQRDRHEKLVEFFGEYQRLTDVIILLRCFRGEPMYYQLIEIPTSLFAPVAGLTREQTDRQTIRIPPTWETDGHWLSITTDRSDAKITIGALKLKLCTLHGEWFVPNLSGVVESEDDIEDAG